MYIFLVLVVYNFGEIAINALLHFSLRGEYWNFIVGYRRRALLSSVLWTVYYFDFSSVDVNEIHFTVNYLSSQFTSKVLSKRLLMNSICNLCWVSVRHPEWLHFYFWTLTLFMRTTWRIHLQSGIPPKPRQLGSYGESGRTYTPAHVDLQAIISTPWVSTVKQRTLKPASKLF